MGVTTKDRAAALRALEGRLVSVILADGSRLECVVISAGHAGVGSVWLDVDGIDVFVPLSRVADFQETSPDEPGQAA